MRVELSGGGLAEAEAELHVLALPEGGELPEAAAAAAGAEDAKGSYRRRTLLRPGRPARLLVLGAGPAGELDAERLRVLAAIAVREARERGLGSVAWSLPEPPGLGRERAAAAIVEGSVLAAWSFERFRTRPRAGDPSGRVDRLVLAAGDEADALHDAVRAARVASAAANRARELQATPANVLTPAALAERAREVAVAFEPVSVEVLGRDEIAERGLGGLAAVASGSAADPRLICMRYSGRGGGERLGLVGKAVTFDSGGISIKPSAGMHEMKMDMSGGAAVIEAVAAMAELGLELDVVAAVPATENMPSGSAMRPGDVITQLAGKTVEVTNTDAEGRLILADALTWCVRELGADRLVDLATLTGAVRIALGSTYSALLANDDEWASAVLRAAEASGELAWRLPLHEEYRALVRGRTADLVNSSAKRKAGTIYAAAFLEEFVEGRPWAHLDIAGTAWEVGREYVGDGPSGVGVRLLVELARALAADRDRA